MFSDYVEKSSKIIKKYSDENGEVYITRGTEFYGVMVIKMLAPGHELHRERGRMDALSAGEFFKTAVRYVRDDAEWVEPVRKFSCKFNPKHSRGCTPTNCPKCLGGSAYWEIFAPACLYRHARKAKTK